MLYEIDESCLTALKTGDEDTIAFFEQLALDRRKCKNIITAKRHVFKELAKNEAFSGIVRNIYNVLGNRVSEHKLIIESTNKYCRIIGDDSSEIYNSGLNQKTILLPISKAAKKDFTDKSVMIAENEEDIRFYKLLGKYYMYKKDIYGIRIDFDEQNGGGSTICNTLERIVNERRKMCLCIVDSDKKYTTQSVGKTMEKVQQILEVYAQEYYEVILLGIHEVENLIPIRVIEEIVRTYNISNQVVKFMKFLYEQGDSDCSPVFYFDVKKGIRKNYFVLNDESDEKEKKKFRKLHEYRDFWRKYIESFGISIDDVQNEFIVTGVCDRTLRYALDVLEQDNWIDYMDKNMHNIWMDIGEKVYSWGCVGNRMAI